MQVNNEKVIPLIKKFAKEVNSPQGDLKELIEERKSREKSYRRIGKKEIEKMDRNDFYDYLGNLWSMSVWGNKKYIVDKILEAGEDVFKKNLINFLFGETKIEDRWDAFLKNTKHVGRATASELLLYSDPLKYALLNRCTMDSLSYLGAEYLPKYDYQYTGRKYVAICDVQKEMAQTMEKAGIKGADLYTVDLFFWHTVRPAYTNKDGFENETKETNYPPIKEEKSLHNEIRDKIAEIGRLLGFESHIEVKVAKGAIVDAVWEVAIGNMGKSVYIFEVQGKGGSIDSLLLNLQKAFTSPAVQAVVAVSDREQLEKIKAECEGLESVEKHIKYWDREDVLEVYRLLYGAHERINKLGLVPDSLISK